MKRLTLSLFAASAAMLTVATPATAQSWQTINQRQANLDQRIDVGVRNGSLNRQEAVRLRTDFRALANLEAQYRRSGGRFTVGERNDLDRRFTTLSQRIRAERNDRQVAGGAWQNINQRQANLDRRIDQGVRNGALTRQEAINLRGEFRALVNLEAQYRRSGNGFTAGERTDLNRRFDRLSARVYINRNDRQARR